MDELAIFSATTATSLGPLQALIFDGHSLLIQE